MAVNVHITEDYKGIPCPNRKIVNLVKFICKRFSVKNAIVSIVITGNKKIRKINIEFLNHRNFTDSISFNLSEGKKRLFELIVNGQKAKSQAAKRGHSPVAELALYITHGLLHNLGFNDNNPKNAEKMHRLEDEILARQGFGKVYKKQV